MQAYAEACASRPSQFEIAEAYKALTSDNGGTLETSRGVEEHQEQAFAGKAEWMSELVLPSNAARNSQDLNGLELVMLQGELAVAIQQKAINQLGD
jgi:hypothetical protein